MLRRREGTSLVELLAALALAGMVLGSATSSVLRQQRTTSRTTAVVAAEAQLRPVVAVVPSELASLAPAAGDLARGQATDSSLQLRSPIALAVQCDSAVSLAAWRVGGRELDAAGVAASPHAGDSLWWYDPATARWIGRRVSAASLKWGRCGGSPDTVSIQLLGLGGADTIVPGAFLRVTRQMRYDIYRAGDGSWQLGLRDWNETTGRFASPQPIAGPLVRQPGSPMNSGFRYFDMAGQELPSGAADVERVARVRFTVASVRGAAMLPGGVVRDSVDVSLLRPPGP